MAWVAPRTWTAGQTVTAAQLNVDIRDNSKALGDPWTAYTPAWTAAGSNPTLGNGSISGAYMQFGKYVTFRLNITMGSTTTYGAGNYKFSLPVNSSAVYNSGDTFGLGTCFDNSAVNRFYRYIFSTSASVVGLTATPQALVDPTTPFTWANNDQIQITGTYEAA